MSEAAQTTSRWQGVICAAMTKLKLLKLRCPKLEFRHHFLLKKESSGFIDNGGVPSGDMHVSRGNKTHWIFAMTDRLRMW